MHEASNKKGSNRGFEPRASRLFARGSPQLGTWNFYPSEAASPRPPWDGLGGVAFPNDFPVKKCQLGGQAK
jgi:hypothetical protein